MLPVPFAFSRMGVLLGVLTMAVVAYSNSLTSVLLLRAAGLTGHDSYEGVAHAVAGPVWKASPCSPLLHAASRLCSCRPLMHAVAGPVWKASLVNPGSPACRIRTCVSHAAHACSPTERRKGLHAAPVMSAAS